MTRYTPIWLQQGTYAASVDRRLVGTLWPSSAVTGCAVTAGTGMTVNVAAGSVAVATSNNTGSVLCVSDAVEQVTLAAAPAAGTNRIDLVTCQSRGNDVDGGANNDFLFTNVTGTPAASPAVPATPANAVALAQIYVAGGSAAVAAGNITDVRPFMGQLSRTIYRARIFRNAAWTSTAASRVAVAFDTVQYDPASMRNGSVLTARVAGDYLVTGQYGYTAGAAGHFVQASIYKNNDLTAPNAVVNGPTAFAAAVNNQIVGTVSDIVPLNTGDTIGISQWNAAAGAGLTGPANTFLSMRLLV